MSRRGMMGCIGGIEPPVPVDNPVLLFYAPLIATTTPVFAWNGNLGVQQHGGGSISNSSFYMPSTGTAPIRWASAIKGGTNLTFSCWVTPSYGSGVNFMFGMLHTVTATRYAGLLLAKHVSQNYISLTTNYISPFAASPAPPFVNSGERAFVSWTIIFDESNSYTVKFYKNGALVYTTTVVQSNWLGVIDTAPGIGLGGNTCPGRYSLFSIYEEMTDEQILKLYQEGGIAM